MTDAGDESQSADESVWIPANAVRLSRSGDSYAVTVSKILDELPIDPGDSVQVAVEAPDPKEPATLQFALEEDGGDPAISNTRTVQGDSRINIPPKLLGKNGLGLDLDDYSLDDPMIFYPLFEPGEPFFGLLALGLASELFRDPDAREGTPIPENAAESARDHPDFKYGTFHAELQRISNSVTESLLHVLGLHSGIDPTIVERQGDSYEIHYIAEGGLADIALGLYGSTPPRAHELEQAHGRAGLQYIEEVYEARGEPIPEKHPINHPELTTLVLPSGDAARETAIAISIADRDEDLAVDPETGERVDESADDEPEEQTEQATLETEDEPGPAPSLFDADIVERTASSHDVDEADLADALETLGDELTTDLIDMAAVAIDDYEPVEVAGDDVDATAHVVQKNALVALADALQDDIADDLAAAAASAHTQQATRLLTNQDADEKYQTFRADYDAILVE